MSASTNQKNAWSIIGAIEAYERPITVIELSVVLVWSIDSIYREVNDGQLPFMRLRGKIVFDPAALGMHFRRRFPTSAAAVRHSRFSKELAGTMEQQQ